MKILHICSGFPIKYPGGITNYVRSLVSAQIKSGMDVEVLAWPIHPKDAPPEFELLNHKSESIRPFSLNILKKDDKNKDLIEKIKNKKYDIIHFHMGLDLDLEFYRQLSLSGLKYIVSLHDYFVVCPRITMIDYNDEVCSEASSKCNTCIGVLDQIDYLQRLSKKIGISLPRIPSQAMSHRHEAMKQFIQGASRILPVSNRVMEIYSQAFPSDRYQVEHIGNDSAYNTNFTKNSSDKIRVAFIGTLSYHKGAEVLVEIMSKVKRPDMEFHFYGRSSKRYINKLISLGLIDHGAYKPSDLTRIMSNTDLGLALPIWEDNAPQVVMEFLNYKTPVLATRMGGIPDFIDQNNGYLFDYRDPNDFSRILDLLNNLSMDELANKSASIKQLKTPDRHCQEIARIYDEIKHR